MKLFEDNTRSAPVKAGYEKLFPAAVLFPYLLAIFYLYYARNVNPDFFIFGSGSWGFACIVKIFLHYAVIQKLHSQKRSIGFISSLSGLFSGISELGAAWLFFRFLPAMNFWQVVAFGTGIGAIEAMVAASIDNPLKGTTLEKEAADLQKRLKNLPGKQKFVYTFLFPWFERLLAGMLHIGTRGLVYLSFSKNNIFPFALALILFFLVDGIIVYRMLFTGKLKERRNLIRMYLYLLILSITAMATFILIWWASPDLSH